MQVNAFVAFEYMHMPAFMYMHANTCVDARMCLDAIDTDAQRAA